MVKAIMHGCNGHMGRVITDIIKNTEGIELVAGVDKYTKVPNDYPVFESIDACDVEADVIIDFSNAAAADAYDADATGPAKSNRTGRGAMGKRRAGGPELDDSA